MPHPSFSRLEQVKALGADVVIPFADPFEGKDFEEALMEEFGKGVQVVVDYLWGQSARTVIAAIARGVNDGAPVRLCTSVARAARKALTCREPGYARHPLY